MILSLDPSLLVQIQIPAHPAPSSAVIGGDSSPSVMHGLVRQSRSVVMPSSVEGGGGEGREGACADSACREKEGRRRQNSPLAAAEISSAQLWGRAFLSISDTKNKMKTLQDSLL